MKRDYSLSKTPIRNIVKFTISFLISGTLMLVLMLILTLMQQRFRLDKHILRITLITLLTADSGFCAFIFRRLSHIKGYICGLINAGIYCFIKLILSFSSGGVGKVNFLIYVCIICSSLIGGIVSANKRKKPRW